MKIHKAVKVAWFLYYKIKHQTKYMSHLNLGLSAVTTPISISLALKSTDRTVESAVMATWRANHYDRGG